MNLLKSPLRRTTALIAGAFIGLVGAVALQAPASAHHPDINASTECPKGDNWTIKWTVFNYSLENRKGYIDEAVFLDKDGQPLSAEAAPAVPGLAVGTSIDMDKSIEVTQTLPTTTKAITLKVTLDWKTPGIEKRSATKTIEIQSDCEPEEPQQPEEPQPEEPQQPATPAEPTPIVEMDCDTIVIGLDNPKDGVEITLTLETSKGEKRELTVKPGEKKTEKFSATAGFTVKVGAEEIDETTEIAYEKPADCSATGAGGGDELAKTGANASTVAGVAGGVLLIGAALFFVARRRKVKFTA